MVAESIIPGKVKRAAVYVSDFGKEQLEKEARLGPQFEAGAKTIKNEEGEEEVCKYLSRTQGLLISRVPCRPPA